MEVTWVENLRDPLTRVFLQDFDITNPFPFLKFLVELRFLMNETLLCVDKSGRYKACFCKDYEGEICIPSEPYDYRDCKGEIRMPKCGKLIVGTGGLRTPFFITNFSSTIHQTKPWQ